MKAAVLAGCLGALVAARAHADSTADAARKILAERCGKCHDGGNREAPAAALKVFDVTEQQWWARLSDRQLPKLNSRMVSFGASESERTRVAEFVAVERARRTR